MSISTEKRAIVTLSIGENYSRLGKFTLPLMQTYADCVGADFHVINSPKIKIGMNHYEKFQLHEYLEEYDRILFVDLDILIIPQCPNIFEAVPQEYFGAFKVSDYSFIHDNSIQLIQQKLGDIKWERDYFNSGVMICSKQHQDVFNINNGYLKKWASYSQREGDGTYLDQTLINYNVKRFNIPFFDISYKFNHTSAPKNSSKRFQSYFIHYPGKGHRKGDKLQQIQKDSIIIQSHTLLFILAQLPILNRILDRIL